MQGDQKCSATAQRRATVQIIGSWHTLLLAHHRHRRHMPHRLRPTAASPEAQKQGIEQHAIPSDGDDTNSNTNNTNSDHSNTLCLHACAAAQGTSLV